MTKGFGTQLDNKGLSKGKKAKKRNLNPINQIQDSLLGYVDEVEDPRVQRTQKHKLTDILVIAILSIIAGGEGWEDMEEYGTAKEEWLREFLELPNGIPSDDTFRRVFERIQPASLEKCLNSWLKTLVYSLQGEIIPIDGKNLRGSYDRNLGQSALHLVTVWASQQRSVLGQVKVEDHSNEITAIPALLELLDV